MPTNTPPNHLFTGAAWRLKEQIRLNPYANVVSVELDRSERRKLRRYDVHEPDVINAIKTLLHLERMPISAQVERKRSRLTGKPCYAFIKVAAGSLT